MDMYNEDSIKTWQEKKYPETVKDQPILKYNKTMYSKDNIYINGMIIDTLNNHVRIKLSVIN